MPGTIRQDRIYMDGQYSTKYPSPGASHPLERRHHTLK
jgi:hypothetical protein